MLWQNYTISASKKEVNILSFIEPKNWSNSDAVISTDLNRIENNIAELKKAETIDVADAEGNFEAANVEGVIAEIAGQVQDGKAAIAASITAMGQSISGANTFPVLAAKIRDISKDATAAAGDILNSKTAYINGAKAMGTMPNRGAIIITPSKSNQAISGGYHNGNGYVAGDADLIANNIKHGVNIFGVVGTYGELQDVLCTPQNFSLADRQAILTPQY